MSVIKSDERSARFDRPGLLAIAPDALSIEFVVGGAGTPPPPAPDGVAVVSVCGPLSFDGFLFDSYDAVRCRVQRALAEGPRVVVLRLDTPGGEVAGAFDTARAIRADCDAAGVPLIAWTGSKAESAGYALACVAQEVVASETAILGSIGVIAQVADTSKALEAQGIRMALITSGARKADGNPAIPLSEDAAASIQGRVDEMALSFFKLVAEYRKTSVEAIAGLQAGIFVGKSAVPTLVDSIESWDALMRRLGSGQIDRATIDPQPAAIDRTTDSAMPEPDKNDEEKKGPAQDSARHALVKALESEDKATVARARRALAAYDEDEDEKSETSDEDEKSAAPVAEGDDEDKKDDGAQAPAAAAVASAMGARLAKVEAELAASRAREEASARAALYAGRPDLPAELVKVLDGLPVAQAREIVEATPKSKGVTFANPHVVQLAKSPEQGSKAPAHNGNPELAAQMGLVQYDTNGVVSDGVIQTFGVAVPKVQK